MQKSSNDAPCGASTQKRVRACKKLWEGAMRAEDASPTHTQSHIASSVLVFEELHRSLFCAVGSVGAQLVAPSASEQSGNGIQKGKKL